MQIREGNKKYTAEFKKHVIETMIKENLSYCETGKRFGINGHHSIKDWEKIYLEKGPDGFKAKHSNIKYAIEAKTNNESKTEEELRAELEWLRAENAYLKNLQALVLEDERHLNKKRR